MQPERIKKALFNKTSKHIEETLKAFLDEHKIEYAIETSESGKLYAFRLNGLGTSQVTVRLWSFENENPTTVFAVPMRVPAENHPKYMGYFKAAGVDINQFNGKVVLLSFAHGIDKLEEEFKAVLQVLGKIHSDRYEPDTK